MTKVYKSARGKMIDIDRIKLSNENTNAVGNMRVNARGDLIGANGQVAMGRNQIMDQAYAVADAPYSPNDPEVFKQQQKMAESSKAKDLHDMINNLSQPTTSLEQVQTDTSPAARGSLAAAAAKTVSVVQQAAPTPQQLKKAQGPTRI